MAQQTKRVKIDTIFRRPINTEDERILQRINFNDEWELMKWYVQVAQKPLQEMSKGDIVSLQEEIKALERTLFHEINPPYF